MVKSANGATSNDFLNSLKRVTMTKGLVKSLGNLAFCTICLEDIQPGETASPLPCSHLFHRTCILESLTHRNCCPNCRRQFPADHHNHDHNRNIGGWIVDSLFSRGRNSRNRHYGVVATPMGAMAYF